MSKFAEPMKSEEVKGQWKLTRNGNHFYLEIESPLFIPDFIKDLPADNFSKGFIDPKFCPYGFTECLNYLEKGWPEGSKKLTLKSNYLNDKLNEGTRQQDTYAYDFYGEVFDIGRILEGRPDHWLLATQQDIPQEELDIYVYCSNAGRIAPESMTNRGAVISAMIDQLYSKYHLNLYLVTKVENLAKRYTVEIKIKVNLKNRYSRDLVSFLTANPGFLRRLIFAIRERITGTHENNYGVSKPWTFEREPVNRKRIYFPVLSTDEERNYQDIKYAQETLERILDRMS